MKEYTTSKYLTRTIHQLEHILADETFPAIHAADLLVATLRELVSQLPEAEKQSVTEIVCLYEQCAQKQYEPLSRRKTPNEGKGQRIHAALLIPGGK